MTILAVQPREPQVLDEADWRALWSFRNPLRYGGESAKFSMSDRRGVWHRTRSHGKHHKAPPAEPTTLCRVSYPFRLVEGIVAEREEDDVVVRDAARSWAVGSVAAAVVTPLAPGIAPGCARKNSPSMHVFVLQADPGAAEIAFVNVLPEADGDFAERAGRWLNRARRSR